MRLPLWLTLTCAAMVILWGAYRMSLGFRSEAAQRAAPKGLFAMARRTHVLMGLVYVLMGGALIAIGLGWSPLSDPPKKPAPVEEPGIMVVPSE